MIAVAPDILHFGKIRVFILRAIGIVPEPDRHARKWRRAGELALLSTQRLAVVVEHFALEAKTAALQLAAIHRQQRIAEREARNDVGAARNRGEQHALLHVAVDIFETLIRQPRAGRTDGIEREQFVRLARLDAGLLARFDPFRADAET